MTVSVIALEDYDGVFTQFVFVQRAKQLTDSFVLC